MNRIPFPPNQPHQAFTQGFYAVGLHACSKASTVFTLGLWLSLMMTIFLSAQRFCMGLGSNVNIIFLVYWFTFSGLFWLIFFLLLADLLCMIIFILLAR
jgi:hypothetical protein